MGEHTSATSNSDQVVIGSLSYMTYLREKKEVLNMSVAKEKLMKILRLFGSIIQFILDHLTSGENSKKTKQQK